MSDNGTPSRLLTPPPHLDRDWLAETIRTTVDECHALRPVTPEKRPWAQFVAGYVVVVAGVAAVWWLNVHDGMRDRPTMNEHREIHVEDRETAKEQDASIRSIERKVDTLTLEQKHVKKTVDRIDKRLEQITLPPFGD